jgi:hypothetical protein
VGLEEPELVVSGGFPKHPLRKTALAADTPAVTKKRLREKLVIESPPKLGKRGCLANALDWALGNLLKKFQLN